MFGCWVSSGVLNPEASAKTGSVTWGVLVTIAVTIITLWATFIAIGICFSAVLRVFTAWLLPFFAVKWGIAYRFIVAWVLPCGCGWLGRRRGFWGIAVFATLTRCATSPAVQGGEG